MKNKIVALLCVVAMLISVFSVTASAAVKYTNEFVAGQSIIAEIIKEKYGIDRFVNGKVNSAYTTKYNAVYKDIIASEDFKTRQQNWVNTYFQSGKSITDQEYSFVFVGDTQYVTYNDAKDGTNNTGKIYKWIADNKDTKNIAHVFALGDMTHMSYENDKNISYDQTYGTAMQEWNVVKAATDQLAAKNIPFSVIRGNHDDYQIDDIYGNDAYYTAQYANGGFYTETSSSSYYYGTSITNSWKTLEVHGEKYLLITIDFNSNASILKWVENVIATHPEHRVIVTTHSYLAYDGSLAKAENDTGSYKNGYVDDNTVDGEKIWTEVLSKYENVFMVCSGHVDADVMYSWRTGVHGNKVLQVVTCPQGIDKEWASTGLVFVMNFSENGQKVEFEYYSPLLDKYKNVKSQSANYLNDNVVRFDDKIEDVGGSIDVMSLSSYGQDNIYLDSKVASAPVLDGVIGANEYSSKNVISNAIYESNLTKCVAYDDKYVYFAFSVKTSTVNDFNFQFTTQSTYNKEDFYSGGAAYDRAAIRFRVNNDGTLTKLSFYGWGKSTWSAMQWDVDVFAGGSRNSSTGVNVYEFKISREYLKNNNVDDSKIGYIVYFGQWYRFDLSSAAQSALGASPAWTYNFISIGSPIKTNTTASIRISTTQNGLRFKSIVDKNTLSQLQAKYTGATISVGTLIAPADLLGTAKLTHSSGIDYMDISATLDKPFTEDAKTRTYAGSITSIKEKNLDRDFVGVGYIKIERAGQTPIYYYSESQSTRSVSYVASMAYADVRETQTSGYEYKISSNDKYGNMYSPYSMAYRNIIKSLIRNKGIKDPFDYDVF